MWNMNFNKIVHLQNHHFCFIFSILLATVLILLNSSAQTENKEREKCLKAVSELIFDILLPRYCSHYIFRALMERRVKMS